MATKAPYYYSEIFPNKNAQSSNDKIGNIKADDISSPDKSRGFHNPLLSIEPDISTSDILEKPSVFQKKKRKKKKGIGTSIYRRSNSLVQNGVHMSPSACYAKRDFDPNICTTPVMSKSHGEHRRRSSEPNIYEEIPEAVLAHDSEICSGSIGGFSLVHRRNHPSRSRKSGYPVSDDCTANVVSDEVAKVQKRHAQILENLNLDVEAMLMPDDSACSEELDVKEINVSPERRIETSAKNTQSPGTPPLYFPSSRWQNTNQNKPQVIYHGRRVMNEYILQQSDFGGTSVSSKGQSHQNQKDQQLTDTIGSGKVSDEPLYMLYDDSHKHQQLSSRDSVCQSSPEDNIYEEVDLQNLAKAENDNTNWLGSGLSGNQFISSGSEEEETGAAKLAARIIGKRKKSKKGKEMEGITGGFTRWFSTRRKEYELEKCMNRIIRNQEEENYVDVKVPKKQRPPLSLPPMPHDLTPEKMKRRYIVGSIVDSENSYVNSLQRLIKDYKRPLEDSNPPIVSANKIGIMFHRVEQILQCHTIFGIALTQCVRQWDEEEKIGDVFVASFSKSMVLDIYSDFINNFSLAMETAKQASKNKSAFADFLKVKQITSPDRLSFFGLMVKPVQRFPQFILLLQDLLKYTPAGHHDRMSLQLALTQLESLAETLNERKRESEQHHAVREVLKHIGKFSLKSFNDKDHYLLRQDDVLQLQLDQSGIVVKSKDRRIFLLNDLLVCVSVTVRTNDAIPNGERLSLKWAVSLQDVEVHEDVAPATKNLLASSGKSRYGSNRSNERHAYGSGTMQSLYEELSNLVQDLEVISRITALVSTLHYSYSGLNIETLQGFSQGIQESIRQKDEEITLLDSCCLQLAVPIKSRSPKETLYFQMATPAIKRDWITDLRLAKLALDPNNTPAWHVPDQEKRPSSKMPLFVKSSSVCTANCATEVKCGCYSTVCTGSLTGQQYLWLCSSDGVNSHLVVMAVHQKLLKQVAAYDLNETRILTMEAVQGCSPESGNDQLNVACDFSDTVWLGTDSRKIILLQGSCPERWEEVGSTTVTAAVLQIKYHCEQVFVALANGSVVIFRKDSDGCWQLLNPIIVTLDVEQSVTCILPLGLNMYCACGNKVWIVDALTAEIQKHYTIQSENEGHVHLLAHSGTGLWITMKNSATVRLYHTETFHHLQDINVASNIERLLTGKLPDKSGTIHVTTLLASRGLLWVGTNVGVVLTVPLPRLEGVPIISGRTNVAFHAHQGPVTLLLSLQVRPSLPVVLPSPLPISSKTVQVHETAENPKTRVQKQKSDSMLPSPAFGKKSHGFPHRNSFSDVHLSGAKTLPRSMTFCPHSHHSHNVIDDGNDVYDLYADLMNIQDYEKDSQEKVYERLNHSDPELMNFHLTTLDRRLQQKTGRPRSWDLSAMAVSEDSDSSAAYDSTSTATSTATTAEIGASSPDSRRLSEDSSSPSHPSTVTLIPEKSQTQTDIQKTKTLNRTVRKLSHKSAHDTSQKTVLMLTGGCGYTNWRKSLEREPRLMSDAHIILWEMKL
ncbi:rho guanine nucleotide exchange factor 10-like protein isoform X2 [Centruroides vittatus]|uniref:rho guanine nucleotide exchange factor 10-like protein isoform X2 n=1 Tax=Centruroides vittatus TaxID=120091 RepID=UPI00350FD4BC